MEQEEAENQSRALFSEIVNQKGAVHLKKAVKADESIIKDQDRLVEEAKKLISNAREERDKRLKEELKRLDYFERACREEERPLLQKLWQKKRDEEKESAAKSFESTRASHRAAWEHGVAEKKRLNKMAVYWERFRASIMKEEGEEEEEENEEEEAEAEDEREQEEEQEEEEEEEAPGPGWAEKEEPAPPKPEPKKADEGPAPARWVPAHLRNKE